MRQTRLAAAAVALVALVIGNKPALACDSESGCVANTIITAVIDPHHPLAISPGAAVGGSVAVAAVAPMIATVVLGRELTLSEAWHIELGVFLGPVGWLLADQMFAPAQGAPGTGPGQGGGNGNGNVHFPPPGAPFLPNEILLQLDSGTSARYLQRLLRRLHLTRARHAALRPD